MLLEVHYGSYVSLSLSLLVTAAALAPADAWAAACTTWSPTLTVAADDDIGSAALQYGWVAVETCDGFTFDHYLFCRFESDDVAYAPAEPHDEGDVCAVSESSQTATSVDKDIVHRSNKDYAATIFACADEYCDDYYGDGSTGGTLDTSAAGDEHAVGTTDIEVWELVGITAQDDAYRVIDHDPDEPVSTTMLFYPEGYTYADKAAFWWSDDNHDTYYLRATHDGNQDWNTYSSWSDSKKLVAEEATRTEGDFAHGNHPWAVAANVDSNDVIRMYFQTHDDADEQQIFSVDSTDDLGDNLGIKCNLGGDCATDGCAYEELCDYSDQSADGAGVAVLEVEAEDVDETELAHARHGKLLWDYLATPVLDFTSHAPGMVFTGTATNDETDEYCYTEYDHDDILQAVWDGQWDLLKDGDDCVETQWAEFHDPGVIPLPDGAFKMYARKEDLDQEISVIYWDPVEGVWEDEQAIYVYLDGTATNMNGCLANPDTAVWKDGSTVDEIMFARTIDDEAVICFDDYGIAYARHEN